MDHTIRLRWYPKQEELRRLVQDSVAVHIGYGGGKGAGKSRGGRQVILDRALRYSGTKHLIFRRTFAEVYKNHVEKLFQEHPATREWYSAQHKTMTIPIPGQEPSLIEFGHGETSRDIQKHQGAEYATQLRDESTHLNEAEHKFLDGCNRYVGPHEDLVPKVIYTMNPGGVGHVYIKRIFITRQPENHERAQDYAFVQAYAWDNAGWSLQALAADQISLKQYFSWTNEQRFSYFVSRTNYGRELNALPETDRLQYLMGDWDVFAGQFFSEFRRDLHVIKAFAIPDYWERFAAADWGFTSPACNLWFAVSPDDRLTLRQGDREVVIEPRSVVCYRESYVTKLSTKELGQAWQSLNGSERLRYRMLDPAFGPTRGGGVSVAEELRPYWPTAPADNNRAQGWARVRQYLTWHRGSDGSIDQFPHCYVFENCANLIRTIPQMVHDKHQVEDLDSNSEDHAVDAFRYGLMSRPPLTTIPLAEMDEGWARAEVRAKHWDDQRWENPS